MTGRTPATLLLANGARFDGDSFGAIGVATGEVCFNTGMTGYQEILTDPSYAGQLVTMTYPHIGNTGVNEEDVESGRIQVAGFIVRDGTATPSNHRMTRTLPDYLAKAGIVGIQNIDTRMLVRMIRSEGAMNGIIASGDIGDGDAAGDDLKAQLAAVPDMTGLDLASRVTCPKPYQWGAGAGKFRVVAYDFGIKYNIMRQLESSGCAITIVPAHTTADEALALGPDGIFLSNGPGDPAAVTPAITAVQDLLGKAPIFGICLGHQILALALGAATYKLPFGHRGLNHPVQHLATGKVEVTSQNHGFAVDEASLTGLRGVKVTHRNLNDNTVEGLTAPEEKAFSVQYHPEAAPGPHDSRYLFGQFVGMMG